MRRALLQVNSRVMRGVLLRAKWQAQAKLLVTAADWPSPRLGLPVKVKLLVQLPAKPRRLEPQD